MPLLVAIIAWEIFLEKLIDFNLPLLNNLYMIYWGQYIDELYHPDTRIIKVEAYLTAEDIYNLNFNDTILIKSTRYRIYKIDYRSGSMSKLELITIINL
jgi:hypothetical protein